jgi:hypothetical protein
MNVKLDFFFVSEIDVQTQCVCIMKKQRDIASECGKCQARFHFPIPQKQIFSIIQINSHA